MLCDYYKTPVPREQELLPDAEEARASAEKGSELEPVEEHSRTAHSLTTEGIEMEILALTKKLEESQKEISCLTKERSDLRRTQEALQVECAQLKDDARRTLANVSCLLVVSEIQPSVARLGLELIILVPLLPQSQDAVVCTTKLGQRVLPT